MQLSCIRGGKCNWPRDWCIRLKSKSPKGREVLGVFSPIGLNGVSEFIHNRETYSTRVSKVDDIYEQTIYHRIVTSCSF